LKANPISTRHPQGAPLKRKSSGVVTAATSSVVLAAGYNPGMIGQEGSFFCCSTVFDTIEAALRKELVVDYADPIDQAVDEQPLCPMPDIAKLIGGKWKLIILQILIFRGTKRFNELRRMIDGVTQTMLTSQLRALERDGLVSRTVYAEVPPRVEYSATPRAIALTKMFHAMHEWWEQNQDGAGR
jgi:DNA-binding HxlR family transcriptional regulator